MNRVIDESVLVNGLSDALQILKGTPLFEKVHEDYLAVLDAAEKLDTQLAKDNEVLKEISEKLSSGMDSRMKNLMKHYEKMCAKKKNVTGCWSEEIARLRSCDPQPSSEATTTQAERSELGEAEEIGHMKIKITRDPLGGGEIKDPIKNKRCGHVYDRTTMREYIESNRARRVKFYQCPYGLCANRRNMDMKDMVDYPEFLSTTN